MTDLKPIYDRVLSAQAKVDEIVNSINAAMALGTPEGDEQALALESTLDEAKANADKMKSFYDKVIETAKTNNPIKNFVPITETQPDPEEKKQNVVKRSEFELMGQMERAGFVKGGGKIED